MSDGFLTARPYAKALFAIAIVRHKVPEWSAALQVLSLIAVETSVTEFLTDPRIESKQSAALFIDVAAKQLDSVVKNFVEVLAINKRLTVLPEIYQLYQQLRAKEDDIVHAIVTSTEKLNQKQQTQLQQSLEKRLSSKVTLQYELDQELLGGVVVCAGDYVIDGSLRGILTRLKQHLI